MQGSCLDLRKYSWGRASRSVASAVRGCAAPAGSRTDLAAVMTGWRRWLQLQLFPQAGRSLCLCLCMGMQGARACAHASSVRFAACTQADKARQGRARNTPLASHGRQHQQQSWRAAIPSYPIPSHSFHARFRVSGRPTNRPTDQLLACERCLVTPALLALAPRPRETLVVFFLWGNTRAHIPSLITTTTTTTTTYPALLLIILACLLALAIPPILPVDSIYVYRLPFVISPSHST